MVRQQCGRELTNFPPSSAASTARKLTHSAGRKLIHLAAVGCQGIKLRLLGSFRQGGGVVRGFLVGGALSHPVALALGRDHGGVVSDAVEKRRGELLVAGE